MNSVVGAGIFLVLALGVALGQGDPASPETTPAEVPAAVPLLTSQLALPSPPEYFLALSKHLKPRWRNLYQPAPTLGRPDRHRGAMALGSLVADSYLAMEARDAQRVRNLIQDLRTVLGSLGLEEKCEECLARITDAAAAEDWTRARWELEGGGAAFRGHFAELRDDDLHVLALLGAWVRSLEMGSRAVAASENPTEHGTWCVGSVDLLQSIQAQIGLLDRRTRELDFVAELELEVARLLKRWDRDFAKEPVTKEDVEATLLKLANYEKRTFRKP